MSNSIALTAAGRAGWIEALLAAPDLPVWAKVVGVRMALHLNLKTGRCNPSAEGLAKRTASSVRSVFRSLTALREAGWIERMGDGHGGRHSNSYRLIIAMPAPIDEDEDDASTVSDLAGLNPDNSGMVEPANHDKPGIVTMPDQVSEPCQGWHTNRESNLEENRESISLSDPTLFGDRLPSPQHSTATGFRIFWDAYPRKVARPAASKAYAAAVKRGVNPAAIVMGAQRYATERAGQDPKYTAHAATWLNGDRWADEATPSGAPSTTSSDRRQPSNLEIAMRGLRR